MTRLSVNINKIALLRNSRNNGVPNLLQISEDCERFGAQGITVHPRPDERHIRFSDVYQLKPIVTTEFNIEGYPDNRFITTVLQIKPHQCTLVPDPPHLLTSNEGWDTIKNQTFLQEIIGKLHQASIRVSLFIDPIEKMIAAAKTTGADRIELYTGNYAAQYSINKKEAIAPFVAAATHANELGLGVNAGHDLNLHNLKYFKQKMPNLLEVSIGHALIADALYFGLQKAIHKYKLKLQ